MRPPEKVKCPVLDYMEIDAIDCIENRELVDGDHSGRFYPDGFEDNPDYEDICQECEWHNY